MGTFLLSCKPELTPSLTEIAEPEHALTIGVVLLRIPQELLQVVKRCVEFFSNYKKLADQRTLQVSSLKYPDFDSEKPKPNPPRPGHPQDLLVGDWLKVCLRCVQAETERSRPDMMSVVAMDAYEKSRGNMCLCGGQWLYEM